MKRTSEITVDVTRHATLEDDFGAGWRGVGVGEMGVTSKLNEPDMPKIGKQNSLQKARRAKLCCDQLQTQKREPLIALDSLQRKKL